MPARRAGRGGVAAKRAPAACRGSKFFDFGSANKSNSYLLGRSKAKQARNCFCLYDYAGWMSKQSWLHRWSAFCCRFKLQCMRCDQLICHLQAAFR